MKSLIIFTLIIIAFVIVDAYLYAKRPVNPNECTGSLAYCIGQSFERVKGK